MKTILTIITLLLTINLSAQVKFFKSGTFMYKITSKSTVAVLAGDKAMSGNVAIPQKVMFNDTTFTVTAIADTGFMNCSGIRSIILPATINKIGKRAFLNCRNLNTINIPYSVKAIPEGTFCYCEALPGITIPDAVTQIGAYAFAHCKNLTRFIVPDNCKTIGDKAFYECSKLQVIKITAKVESIGKRVFQACYSLIRFEVEPENQKYVALESVLYTRDMQNLIKYPSYKDSQTYDIPSGVKTIDEHAFEKVRDLALVRFPNTLTRISCLAFVDCENLLRADYPSSIKQIGEDSFFGCSKLQESSISGNVDYIEYDYQDPMIEDLE
ncbi:MAG: leucine-rich repeat domain-containing protein [Bacteroidales bacterium]|nr:leucine-rich repeat domain-containing protein [Bacteroidales bacterium]